MLIRSETLSIEIPGDCPPLRWISRRLSEDRGESVVLRWGVLRIEPGRALVEVARLTGGGTPAPLPGSGGKGPGVPAGVHVALVVPTGVGASIGGFVGDAGPVVRVLEEVADTVIVHPNVVNGADFYGAAKSLYVDGLTFDRFLEGAGRLRRRTRPLIGLLVDQLTPRSHARLLNAANGWRAVMGAELVGYAVCKERLRTNVRISEEGHFIGDVDNPEVLFEAAERLCDAGANCIAVVSDIEGIENAHWLSHYQGGMANPMGALEALISRAITWKTGLPSAHAPSSMDCVPDPGVVVDPRAAADVASGTGLPCVLQGLGRHAAFASGDGEPGIAAADLSAIIVPYDCAGGVPAMVAEQHQTPLIAVRGNDCLVGANTDGLGISTAIVVRNYAEAIAFVAARRAGVDWNCLDRPLEKLREIKAPVEGRAPVSAAAGTRDSSPAPGVTRTHYAADQSMHSPR
jgi:uncharacterized protein DUF3326